MREVFVIVCVESLALRDELLPVLLFSVVQVFLPADVVGVLLVDVLGPATEVVVEEELVLEVLLVLGSVLVAVVVLGPVVEVVVVVLRLLGLEEGLHLGEGIASLQLRSFS